MLLKQEQMEILELLAQHEKSVQLLYEEYARKFAENALFWRNLAADEALHASWIDDFKVKIDAGIWHLKEGRFNKASLKTSLEYIRNKIEQAQNNQLSQVEAISTALDLERSLIERNFFEVLKSDSSELRILLTRLSGATQTHLSMVQAEWRRLEPRKLKL